MAYLAVRRRLVDRLSRGWTGACLALLLLLPLRPPLPGWFRR